MFEGMEKDAAKAGRKRSRSARPTIVVPVLDPGQAPSIVRLAVDLAAGRQGRVILVGMVLVPPASSLSTGALQAQRIRQFLRELQNIYGSEVIDCKARIRVSHEGWPELRRLVVKEKADFAFLPWHTETGLGFPDQTISSLLDSLPCHVVVAGGVIPGNPQRILMPIRGSQEAPLTLKVALSLAQASAGRVTMLYAPRDDWDPRSRQIFREIERMSQGNPHIERELRIEEDLYSAIQQQIPHHDLVILGASTPVAGTQRRCIGRIAGKLKRDDLAPVLMVRTYDPAPLEELSGWQPEEPLPDTAASVVVDRWFAENTFSSREFEDIGWLVARKKQQGLTISLGLPALNEEETIGNVIQTVRKSLMEEFPLLDEIVLIDSGSTDRTVEIARELDIPVYRHAEILPEQGSYQGKGEALWKSLYVLKGDLIAWMDTDIVNPHPRFVYGLLGPLLRHPSIQYVKGFFRRPLKVDGTLQAGGGGRVTELVARPLLNLFYPELSGFVQPLSGEYAGRREALERQPFYVGYGVETGLLLSLVETYGISGLAQVDLLQKIHHSQSLSALSRMSFAITQVFLDRLEARQRVELVTEMNRTMKIIRYEKDSYRLEEHAIRDERRPPVISIPEYRELHGYAGEPKEDCPEETSFA